MSPITDIYLIIGYIAQHDLNSGNASVIDLKKNTAFITGDWRTTIKIEIVEV